MATLLFSDVHANAAAVEAVLEAEPDPDAVIFLGDAVDCGPRPDQVVSLLADLPGEFLMGNHDRTVLDADADDPDDQRSRWQYWSRERLSASNLRTLESWSNSTVVERTGRRLRLHHGNFPRPSGFEGTWPERIRMGTDEAVFAALAERYPEPYVCFGHSHYPCRRTVDGTTFLNPGTVGLQRPGRRQDLAHYAVLEEGVIAFRGVEYDLERVQGEMRALPLDKGFVADWNDCFRTGEGPRPH